MNRLTPLTTSTLDWNFGSKKIPFRQCPTDDTNEIERCIHLLGLDHVDRSVLDKGCVVMAYDKKREKIQNKLTHLNNVFKYNGRLNNPMFKRALNDLVLQMKAYIAAGKRLIAHLDQNTSCKKSSTTE